MHKTKMPAEDNLIKNEEKDEEDLLDMGLENLLTHIDNEKFDKNSVDLIRRIFVSKLVVEPIKTGELKKPEIKAMIVCPDCFLMQVHKTNWWVVEEHGFVSYNTGTPTRVFCKTPECKGDFWF